MKCLFIFRYFSLPLLCMVLLGACGKGSTGRHLSVGEPIMIEEFKMSEAPASMSCFPNDEIGIKSIKVLDSLLIIGHSDHWSIYEKAQKQHTGNYLSIGDGPGEFLYVRPCSNAYFTLLNDSLSALIPDEDRHRVMKLNLRKCEAGDVSVPSVQLVSEYLENRSWDVTVCGENAFLVSQPHEDMKGFTRLLVEADGPHRLECAVGLDTVKVKDNEAINLLSRVTRYEPTNDKFVETMNYLNQINILSRDGKSGKTLCVGSHLDDLSIKEDTYNSPSRQHGYITVAAWPVGFGAVYSGLTDEEWATSKDIESEFQFFDWDGNPKYRFKLPGYVLAFDIDFDEKIMYMVEEQEDVLKAYDATSIIDSLM